MSPLDPFGFDLVALLFTIGFLLILVCSGLLIGSAIYQGLHGEQPLLTHRARVVGRRKRVSRLSHHGRHDSRITYFITFEFEDASREEFAVQRDQHDRLAAGDFGLLSSRGAWFRGFDRDGSVWRR